jgi:hypothetical protein
MASVYDSERLAAAYAFDRPSVHGQILRSARLTRQAARALDLHELPLAGYGLRLLGYADAETRLPMTIDAYLRYVLSETNVENSIARGAYRAAEARDWPTDTGDGVRGRRSDRGHPRIRRNARPRSRRMTTGLTAGL